MGETNHPTLDPLRPQITAWFVAPFQFFRLYMRVWEQIDQLEYGVQWVYERVRLRVGSRLCLPRWSFSFLYMFCKYILGNGSILKPVCDLCAWVASDPKLSQIETLHLSSHSTTFSPIFLSWNPSHTKSQWTAWMCWADMIPTCHWKILPIWWIYTGEYWRYSYFVYACHIPIIMLIISFNYNIWLGSIVLKV